MRVFTDFDSIYFVLFRCFIESIVHCFRTLALFITGESSTVGQFRASAKWPYSRRKNFRAPFQGTPTLTYGLYFLDSSQTANLRVHASVTNVSRTGFEITMKSWANSVLYGGYVCWMACGK